jgi:hypothetical protein
MVSMDDMRHVAYHQQESARLHQLRRQQPEAYNVESQAHTAMLKKAVVYAGVHACSFTSAIFGLNFSLPSVPWRAVGLSAALPVGLGLGYVIVSAAANERQFYERERNREEWELENFPDGEYEEMTAIYMQKGLSETEARHFVRLLSRDTQNFVDIMMVDELGYSIRPLPTKRDTLRAGMLATATFCSVAILPLVCQQPRPGQAILAGIATLVSVLEAKLLFGAYADVADALRALRNNALWLVTVASIAALSGAGLKRLAAA